MSLYKKAKPQYSFIASEPCAGISVFSPFPPIAVIKLNKHRCNYWEEKEHLPSSFLLSSTIALPTWVQAACQLPAFPDRFFPLAVVAPLPKSSPLLR